MKFNYPGEVNVDPVKYLWHSLYQSTEMVPNNLVSEIIPSLTFADLPCWELGRPIE
jgi:hypothetical protein